MGTYTHDQQKAYYAANRDRLRAMARDYYAANRTRSLEKSKAYHSNMPAHVKEKRDKWQMAYYRRNKPARLAAMKEWAKNNKARRNAISRKYMAKHRSTPEGKLNHRMSTGIRASILDKKNGRWEHLVGYTKQDLKRHVENNFKPGMNWQRLMAGEIHIDHVVPKAKFNYTSFDDPQFRQCWALENLMPEWASKNFSKGAKILRPTQIALGI